MRAIAAALPPDHQTILCSATWPAEVRRAAASLLRSTHVAARVGRAAADGSGGPAASRTVVQRVVVVAPRARWAELLRPNPNPNPYPYPNPSPNPKQVGRAAAT